jgi:N6-L-threonylcarbamoyladenine synthase
MKRLVIAGGVSANTMLRTQMKTLMDDLRGEVFYPNLAYCTDNGAMIAYAGMQRLKAGEVLGLSSQAKPRWPLDTLAPV